MNFDDVLVEIGEFGKFQKILYCLLNITAIHAISYMVIDVFLLAAPEHRCAIPGYDNDTYAKQSQYHQILINQLIPAPSDSQHVYDECHVYPSNVSHYDNDSRPINVSATPCDRWVYDESVYGSTLVTQLNLVCDQDYLPSLAKSLFFAGVLVGAFVFGLTSDLIGRKKNLILTMTLLFVSTFSLAWAESFAVYVICRFCSGACNAGVFMTVYILGMEFVGPSKRMWAGLVSGFFNVAGFVILSGIAYWIKDWKYIAIAVSVSYLIYFPYFCIIPESPRWLLSRGRVQEAEAIIYRAARINKATLPKNVFRDIAESKAQKGQVWHLFSTKVMAVRTVIILINWMVVSMTFYGLSLNAGSIGGDVYINFMLSGLVEIPAYIMCLTLLNRLGRRAIHVFSMVLGGLACISTVFTTLYGGDDLEGLTVALALIGKFGAASAFATIYLLSAELYPTVVRNAGMGASSCSARVGGILAPYIGDLNKVVPGDFGKALPLVIFGTACVVAGLLALVLPETLGKELPETIDDAKNFGKSKKTDKEIYINAAYEVDVKKNGDLPDKNGFIDVKL